MSTTMRPTGPVPASRGPRSLPAVTGRCASPSERHLSCVRAVVRRDAGSGEVRGRGHADARPPVAARRIGYAVVFPKTAVRAAAAATTSSQTCGSAAMSGWNLGTLDSAYDRDRA
jgi:hypothetical protein